MSVLRSMITEYGMQWVINRALYSCKLKLLRLLPRSERCFETAAEITVQRLDIFDIDIKAIGDFLKALPEAEQSKLIKTADEACDGRICGFSSITLNYGNPINWQKNPLTEKSCDASKKWFQIPDFDPERGDIKVVWEASRFTHFYVLARAYLLTGDKKYYEAFSRQLRNWLEQNPYSYGANYKCGQECALRLINGLMVYSVFARAGLANSTDEANVKELISRCYRKILSNFFYAYKCIRNNHTISELVGMIVGAWCCEDDRRVEKAYRILDKVICEQFTEDGGYRQFSFNYQRLALQDIECVLSISEKTGRKLNPSAIERIKQSCLLLYQCQNTDGDVPNYGSNDGALIFPVTSCGYRDYRPFINCVHALTTGTRLYDAGLYDEELLWFASGIDKYKIENVPRCPMSFPDAGLFTLRKADSFTMLVLNDYKSRPAHMDQLHLDLWIDGVNVFCDLGTYSYAEKLGTELASTGGHNNVKVHNTEQMNKHGAFMLCDWTKRESVAWHGNSFNGTMVSHNGYTHHRRVEETETGYRIIDEVQTSSGQATDILFHTPREVIKTDAGVLLFDHGKPICALNVGGAEMEIEEAQRSIFYLQSETIRLIHVHMAAAADMKKITTEIKIWGNSIDD